MTTFIDEVIFFSGYVCSRHDVLANGCCNVESSSTNRYHCESCHDNGCCSIYEYCISCCLQPEKVLEYLTKAFNVFQRLKIKVIILYLHFMKMYRKQSNYYVGHFQLIQYLVL